MIQTIVFATGNKGKFSWLQHEVAIAGLSDVTVEMAKMDLLELQSESLEEISLHKAKQAFEILKKPVLVMDGGFYIKELNGFPGPFARYMFDQMGPENIAKLASVLTDRSCYFKNVVTFIEGPDQYQQFVDTTGDIYALSPDVYPHDHPQQWASVWRVLVPAGLGYTQPLASFSDQELKDYAAKRAARADHSSLNDFVKYLKRTQDTMTARTGT